MPVLVTFGKLAQRFQVARAIESHAEDAAPQHFQKVNARSQMESSFCKHCFAGKQGQFELPGKALRPPMMLIAAP